MLGRVLTIALNTYREASRARVLYGLVGVALATAFYSIIVGAYTLRSAPRTVSDLGSASISIYSVAVAIMLAASSLYRELEQKTIFPILARPLRRWEYLIGKYIGTLIVLVVFVAIDAAVVLLTLAVHGGTPVWIVLGVGATSTVGLVIYSVKSTRYGVFAPIPWALAMLGIASVLASGLPMSAGLCSGCAPSRSSRSRS